ncbi:MAG: hypothetical protein NDF55_10415 [archaeon GB-1867-005]|nr:hypothetical protein [Candidatus Culexmicrobium cathedralense]
MKIQNETVRKGKWIKVKHSTWRKLVILKLHLDVRSYDEVINFLINKYYRSMKVEV